MFRLMRDYGFNPRTRESATASSGGSAHRSTVSIHALVRVRPEPGRKLASFGSFNPRTRESATNVRPEEIKTCIVSIHALVRVRLWTCGQLHQPFVVSIHALVRVRRPGRLWLEYQQRNGCFAPTSHGGTHIPGRKKEMIVVKIRTPTDYVNRRCPGNFL